METLRFFLLRFRRAYDFAYESDFRFSLGYKRSYHSDHDSDSDSVASENQPLVRRQCGALSFVWSRIIVNQTKQRTRATRGIRMAY